MPTPTARPFTPFQETLVSFVTRTLGGGLNVWLYRASGGRIMGRFPTGQPIILVTTTGRKTSKLRTSPLLFIQDGANYIVVASKGGVSQHPAWFNNLTANPGVTIEHGARRLTATARVATTEERAAYWPRLVKFYPSYASYQARTEREIPVVILTPLGRTAL